MNPLRPETEINRAGIVLRHDSGRRTADPSKCYYCNQKIGQKHLESCVCLSKVVKVRATIEYEIEVPYSWTDEDIEFHRNEGSWCSDNMLEELEAIAGQSDRCLCSITTFKALDVVDPGPYSTGMSETELRLNPGLICDDDGGGLEMSDIPYLEPVCGPEEYEEATQTCPECEGDGTVTVEICQAGDQTLTEERACPNCGGSGVVPFL